MSEQVRDIVRKTVQGMLRSSMSDPNIRQIADRHRSKVHFVPIRYRVIGGILQGLNIKFGNFIEQLLASIIELDEGVKKMPDSGKRVRLFFTQETDALIDNYITGRQLPDSPDDCTPLFDDLLSSIIRIESNSAAEDRQGIVKDIDALFRTSDGLTVFAELKYNDDHDTGKFADINRKFIKTWAGLAVRLRIESPDELLPILYYLNPRKRYGPIHTPSRNIMRGPQLFDRFLQTRYEDLDTYLAEIGDDQEVLRMFDEMFEKVRNGDLNTEALLQQTQFPPHDE